MKCIMFDHYVMIDHEGRFKPCNEIGYKNYSKVQFNSYKEMKESSYIRTIKEQLEQGIWPAECTFCSEKESQGIESIRQKGLRRHPEFVEINPNYLKVDLVSDNICNGACQFCHAGASTRIGMLYNNKVFFKSNIDKLNELPLDDIVRFELIGGETSFSPYGKEVLTTLPKNVKEVRISTNGSKMITEIIPLLEKGVTVWLFVSFDGTNGVFDYVRWPLSYSKTVDVIKEYQSLGNRFTNLKIGITVTVCSLNVNDLENVYNAADDLNIVHRSVCLVSWPDQLDARYQNSLTLSAKEKLLSSKHKQLVGIGALVANGKRNQEELDSFITQQDLLRKINIEDFIKDHHTGKASSDSYC